MKMITATMAKNIATDFEHNENLKRHITSVMEKILNAAEHCERKVFILHENQFCSETWTTIYIFWQGLGYQIDAGSTAYTLKW